jgi:hypothetical protein
VLKLALALAQVLHTFDPTRRVVLVTDASNVALATIMTQLDDKGHQLRDQHPVAYESRKLTVAERIYPAYILELLAEVQVLCTFRRPD